MSHAEVDPKAAAAPVPAEPVGIGRVLNRVRKPEEVRQPHVVVFRGVTKTFNPGKPNEFMAIRDVSFRRRIRSGWQSHCCLPSRHAKRAHGDDTAAAQWPPKTQRSGHDE